MATDSTSDRNEKSHKAPGSNLDFDFFYEGLERNQILVQKCMKCGKLRNPPSPACPDCAHLEWTTEPVSGRGSIFSYIVHHHPPLPTFETPHPVALAELDDGIRFLAAMDGTPPEELEIGKKIEPEFVRRNGVACVRFRIAS